MPAKTGVLPAMPVRSLPMRHAGRLAGRRAAMRDGAGPRELPLQCAGSVGEQVGRQDGDGETVAASSSRLPAMCDQDGGD